MKKILFAVVSNFLFIGMFLIADEKTVLKPEKVLKMTIPEPSGLSMDKNGGNLWCVSDFTEYLYKISFDGKVKEYFKYAFVDAEAVTDDGESIWVAEERANRLNRIKNGKIVETVDIEKVSKKKKQGIEGIAVDLKKKEFYVANSKKPALISVYNMDNWTLKRKFETEFSDISDLYFDEISENLWVLSHEDSAVFIMDNNMKVTETLKFNILQAEGIAVDHKNGFFYVCSDKDSLFYVFKIPDHLTDYYYPD